MSDTNESRVTIHVTTSGETRHPIGSKASPFTIVSDEGGVYQVTITRDGQPFDPAALGESDPRLEHLEAHIRENGLDGVWKLWVTAPLWNATWERSSDGEWLCVLAGEGYA